MKKLQFAILVSILVLFSCEGETVGYASMSDSIAVDSINNDTLLLLTQSQADSLEFRLKHHYTNNFNFVVKADTLMLIPLVDDAVRDTCWVNKGDVIAVAAINQSDTVLVKVARDQYTMGWISEEELLAKAVPDDMISQMIDRLTGSRAIWMSILVVLGIIGFLHRRRKKHKLQIFQFDEMDSFYPILMLILVGILASLYASIQNFAPEFWQEYYFHPTLNPLILPTIMAILVVTVWLLLIVFIALVLDVYHHFYALQGINYLLELCGLSMLVYLAISWTTRIYVGYFLLITLIVILLWIYFKHIRCSYLCGACGGKMRKKGICPHCGQENI